MKQIFLHIEVATRLVKLEIKELKRKNKNGERPFDFTEHLEMQKGENEISGFVFQISQRKQSSTSKHSHRGSGKIGKWLFDE